MLNTLAQQHLKKSKITLYWDRSHIGLLAIFIFLFGIVDPRFYIGGLFYVIYFRKSIHIGLLLTLLCLFFARYYLWDLKQPPHHFQGDVMITHVEEKLYHDQLTVRFRGIYVHIYTKKATYSVGQALSVKGDIYQYKAQTIPKGFHLKNYYLSQNIKGYMDDPHITILYQKFDWYIGRAFLEKHIESYQSQGYMHHVFLGNHTLPKEIKDIYQSSGLWFLLSFSGIHLYVLMRLIKKALYYGNASDIFQKIMVCIIYGLILYLQRGSWVIWRLIIIHFLSFLHREEHLNTTIFERILLGFLILLLFQIHLIHHQGFLITLCILGMLSMFSEWFNRTPPMLNHMLRSYFISAILIGFVSSFHVLMIMWMPLFIFIFSYIMLPLAIIAVFFKPFDGLLYHLFKSYEYAIDNLYHVTPAISLPRLSAIVSVFIVLLLLLFLISKTWKRRLMIGFVMLICFSWSTLEIKVTGGHIIFLDVEQGDSTIVITPDCVFVVDSYQYVVSYLNAHGIKQIDYLILTHAHMDHIKEADDVLRKLDVSHVLLNPHDIYDISHHSILRVKQGDFITCGDIEINILGPVKRYQNSNNNSLVLQFKVFEKVFLLTGDIEAEAEADIAQIYGKRLKSDVIKIAHHGSHTSSTEHFINLVKPQVAVISLKSRNRYHFPHESVLHRLNRHQIITYQTNLTGSITHQSVNKREKWGFYLPF